MGQRKEEGVLGGHTGRGVCRECEPSPGHLGREGGDTRAGGLLKYFYIVPLLSLKGTQSYPTRPWGQPRLEVQRAAPWGGGRERGGAKPGKHQNLENMPRDKEMPLLFFSSPNPITHRWPPSG